MTLLRIALRSHLGGFIGVTAVAAFLNLANAAGFVQIAGPDAQSRAIFAQQMELVGRQLSFILPMPLELDTVGGYLQWRSVGTLGIVYVFWTLIAGSGVARGDEERGMVGQWLETGVGRTSYLLTRAVAFAVVALVSVTITSGAALVGAALMGESLDAVAAGKQGIALFALTLCCFGFVILLSQLAAARRSAAGIAGVVLFGTWLINSAARNGVLEQLRPLSPFAAYERSAPLLSTGDLDIPGTLGLLAAWTLFTGAAAVAFSARDLGSALFSTRPRTAEPVYRPSHDPLLRLPVLAAIGPQRDWIAGWAVGLAALAAFLVSLTRTMVDALIQIPTMRIYFERLGATGYDSFVGTIWGSTVLLLLALFAIFQVSAWVADDQEGRVEATLAHPVPRARVVLDRLGSLLVASATIVATGAVTVWIASASNGIDLSGDRFVQASLLMVAVPYAFGAVGGVLAGWRPRLAVSALTVVAILSWFTQQFGPLFEWPEWVLNTSIFGLYGTPMSTGVEWGGTSALIAIGLAGTALSVLTMQRRDVGR